MRQKKPPIDLLRKHSVPMAVASDLNPGTSALCSLQLMMNMAAVSFDMKVEEVLLATTQNAALALGLQDKKGKLAIGFDADFCIWNTTHPREIVCSYMPHLLDHHFFKGRRVNTSWYR